MSKMTSILVSQVFIGLYVYANIQITLYLNYSNSKTSL